MEFHWKSIELISVIKPNRATHFNDTICLYNLFCDLTEQTILKIMLDNTQFI